MAVEETENFFEGEDRDYRPFGELPDDDIPLSDEEIDTGLDVKKIEAVRGPRKAKQNFVVPPSVKEASTPQSEEAESTPPVSHPKLKHIFEHPPSEKKVSPEIEEPKNQDQEYSSFPDSPDLVTTVVSPEMQKIPKLQLSTTIENVEKEENQEVEPPQERGNVQEKLLDKEIPEEIVKPLQELEKEQGEGSEKTQQEREEEEAVAAQEEKEEEDEKAQEEEMAEKMEEMEEEQTSEPEEEIVEETLKFDFDNWIKSPDKSFPRTGKGS